MVRKISSISLGLSHAIGAIEGYCQPSVILIVLRRLESKRLWSVNDNKLYVLVACSAGMLVGGTAHRKAAFFNLDQARRASVVSEDIGRPVTNFFALVRSSSEH